MRTAIEKSKNSAERVSKLKNMIDNGCVTAKLSSNHTRFDGAQRRQKRFKRAVRRADVQKNDDAATEKPKSAKRCESDASQRLRRLRSISAEGDQKPACGDEDVRATYRRAGAEP